MGAAPAGVLTTSTPAAPHRTSSGTCQEAQDAASAALQRQQTELDGTKAQLDAKVSLRGCCAHMRLCLSPRARATPDQPSTHAHTQAEQLAAEVRELDARSAQLDQAVAVCMEKAQVGGGWLDGLRLLLIQL